MRQTTRHYCTPCRSNVIAEREPANHVLHGILSLLTFWAAGGWIWVWLLVALNPKWRCRDCGARTFGGYARAMFRNVALAAVIVAAVVAFAML